MLCLVHNLATERTRALHLPVWRYRFDHVASNLNSRGTRIGAFHGKLNLILIVPWILKDLTQPGSDIRFVMGQWRFVSVIPQKMTADPLISIQGHRHTTAKYPSYTVPDRGVRPHGHRMDQLYQR